MVKQQKQKQGEAEAMVGASLPHEDDPQASKNLCEI